MFMAFHSSRARLPWLIAVSAILLGLGIWVLLS